MSTAAGLGVDAADRVGFDGATGSGPVVDAGADAAADANVASVGDTEPFSLVKKES